MLNKLLFAILFCCLAITVFSQTLFTYGTYKASAQDFERAFNKNNQQPSAMKAKAMKEYLNLYINSRLKIQEAYERHLDTLPQIKSEVDNLRGQVIDNYMSDPETITRLTREAFQRSQKDIHAAHIFISFARGGGMIDSSGAKEKLATVVKRLAKGDDFMTVAQQLSDDPSARTNKGDLDYITVFTLPYEFESMIYKTAPGKYSNPYASNAGFHIFKNISERKAIGKLQAQQILLAFPPGVDEAGKKVISKTADSLYQVLIRGGDFDKLAMGYSNDYNTAASGGKLPEIGVGQYESTFEKTVWSLPANGAISKPILTSHGYHIVKRLAIVPIISNPSDKANNEYLEGRVKADDRWKTSKDFIYTRVAAHPGVQVFSYEPKALAGFTDSLIDNKPAGPGRTLKSDLPVFNIGNTSVTLSDWVTYVQGNRYRADRSSFKTYTELMDEFKKHSMYQYYHDHLEDFNDDFRIQMSEFRDGNMFFEIMQQEVWNKAQSDSVALLSLYQSNKSNYTWKQSADAIIFFCSDQVAGKELEAQLKKNPKGWRTIVESMSEKVVADSARYEWPQLPGVSKTEPVAGKLTTLTVNPTDNTASLAYVVRIYKDTAPRSFTEARGLVMNDYQLKLEEDWIKELKKKYPVMIDEKVFEQLSK